MWRVWIEISKFWMENFTWLPSPSVWRVWIEIFMPGWLCESTASPSVWRVWIEMTCWMVKIGTESPSPSVWRVWIEIRDRRDCCSH